MEAGDRAILTRASGEGTMRSMVEGAATRTVAGAPRDDRSAAALAPLTVRVLALSTAGACHRAGRRPDPLGGPPPPLRG